MICLEMQVPVNANDVADLVARLASGEVRALSRAISLVEDGAPCAGPLIAACKALARRSQRIGVTGSAGVGKSTLVDQMVRHLRGKGERVAVVAVDPTSPFTGGALLGDRIRMQGFSGDGDVFIRSMASRGGAGGVAEAADGVCMVLEAAGFGTVIIETVGAGQGEIRVTDLVDLTLLVLVPGTGDDVQSLKAGLMEAADIFVINKADQPGAAKIESDVKSTQSLNGDARPLQRTNALSGDGMLELMALLEQCTSVAGSRNPKDGSPKLDHIGIAVRSIAAARGFYESLGALVTEVDIVDVEQVRTAMMPFGAARIELLEPTAADSVVGRFITRRGEGIHHVALRVADVEAEFTRMKAAGVRLVSDRVRTGAGGHSYFFVHPASAGGVLLELVGD